MLLMHAADVNEFETEDAEPAERRRGLRVQQHRPIKVLEGMSGRYFGGRTQDVSATGLRIELPAHCVVQHGSTLYIHVGLNSSGESLANRRQMIPARIVWIRRPRGANKAIVAGVEFAAGIGAQLHAA